MRAPYVPNLTDEALLDPSNPVWKRAAFEQLKLEGTPLGLQPTAPIVNNWANRKIDSVGALQINAAATARS